MKNEIEDIKKRNYYLEKFQNFLQIIEEMQKN